MISLVAASERERGQTREHAFWGCGSAFNRETLAEERWKAQPERVTAPYAKRSDDELTPEYRRTRGIRWEAGRTTSQA